MKTGLSCESLEIGEPSRAARLMSRVVLRAHGRHRGSLLLVVDHAPRPGLSVAPWTVEGLVVGAREIDTPLAVQRMVAGGAVADGNSSLNLRVPGSRRALRLRVPGCHRAARVPQAWIGAHACVVAPCWFSEQRGPVGGALQAIASALQGGRAADERIAAWTLARTFASVSLVIDATWAAVGEIDTAELSATARCLAVTEAGRHVDAAALDAAIASELQLRWQPRRGHGSVGLANRTVASLWRTPARAGRVPGPFGRQWDRAWRHPHESPP